MTPNKSPKLTVAKLLLHYGPRGATQILIAIANFVQIQVAARLLIVGEFGVYSLILAGTAFSLLVFFQWITDSTNRFVSEAFRSGQQEELQRTVAKMSLLTAAGVFALCVLTEVAAVIFRAVPQNINIGMLVLAPIFIVLYSLGAVASTYFNARAEHFWYVLTGAGIPALGGLAGYGWSFVHHQTALSLIGTQACVLAAILLLVVGYRPATSVRIFKSVMCAPRPSDQAFASRFVSYASSLPFLAFATYSSIFGDRLMVAAFFSLTDVGQYAYMFVLTTNIVLASYNVYATATYLRAVDRLSSAANNRDYLNTMRQFILASVAFPTLFLPLVVIYSVAGPDVLKLIMGPSASAPPFCLPVLMLSACLFGGAQQLALVGNLLKHQRRFVTPRWVLLITNFTAIALYHPSLLSVCIMVLCGNALYVVIVAWLVRDMMTALSAAQLVIPPIP